MLEAQGKRAQALTFYKRALGARAGWFEALFEYGRALMDEPGCPEGVQVRGLERVVREEQLIPVDAYEGGVIPHGDYDHTGFMAWPLSVSAPDPKLTRPALAGMVPSPRATAPTRAVRTHIFQLPFIALLPDRSFSVGRSRLGRPIDRAP